jgi:signal transduction histidine kinase/ActR/RegA family two-component response regulator
MQQYSSLPEQNLQVDAKDALLTTIEQLRAELWQERSLNQLQRRLNECLIFDVTSSENPQVLEAKIFQTAIDELKRVLNVSQVAIALTQPEEAVAKICYISSTSLSSAQQFPSPGLVLKTGERLQLGLEINIRIENLQDLERQLPACAFAIAVSSGQLLGWVILVDDQNKGNCTWDEVCIRLRKQFISRAVEQLLAALAQLHQVQSLQQVCRHLEGFNGELERTNQLKNQFLASTSHEIRTPLSSILGFTHLLLVQGFDPDRERHQEYLNIIQSSGKHLLALINDILDLSKIEANQMDVQCESVNLPTLCRTVFAVVKEKAANKGLQLRLELDPDVGDGFADSLRLKQMLLNLLFNALKFTSTGTVGLQVKLQGEFVHFIVWDTGTGIPKEYQGELFQPYSQIANALVGRDEGTGLGLAITQKLAELHGGYVEVESEVDKGSCFTLVLPLNPFTDVSGERHIEEISENNNNYIPISPYPLVSFLNSPSILLVEDDLQNAQLMQTYLGKLGYRVTWVKSASQMWQSLTQLHPAVILMDIYLPDGNGLQIIKQLRAETKYQNITVIAQTAMAMKGDREISMASGFNDYISKPIDLPLLAKLISKYSIGSRE